MTNYNERLGATDIRIPYDIFTCRRFLSDQFRAESGVRVYSIDSLTTTVSYCSRVAIRDVILHVILSLSIHASGFYERTLKWIAVERQKVTACPGISCLAARQ